MVNSTDFLVIGAGISGASAAYELSKMGTVTLLERERQPGYHTTGRSAALFVEAYGNTVIRAITRASRAFYDNPPDEFAGAQLLSPRGSLLVATEQTRNALEAEFAKVRLFSETVRKVDATEVHCLHPGLNPELIIGGLYFPDDSDIDVAALHLGFIRGMRAKGGLLRTDAEVLSLARNGSVWRAKTQVGDFEASVVVNAAGAWADEIGALVGAAPIGLVPKRRTAFTFDAPEWIDPSVLPGVIAADESWYVKPESGQLLGSPADETPTAPCDAQAEELDLAIAVDRIQAHTVFKIDRLASKWAGLRSFVADKSMVAGIQPGLEGFCWCADQGGYGIQTAPAMGRITAALACDSPFPADIIAQEVTPADLAPDRIALEGAERFKGQ